MIAMAEELYYSSWQCNSSWRYESNWRSKLDKVSGKSSMLTTAINVIHDCVTKKFAGHGNGRKLLK